MKRTKTIKALALTAAAACMFFGQPISAWASSPEVAHMTSFTQEQSQSAGIYVDNVRMSTLQAFQQSEVTYVALDTFNAVGYSVAAEGSMWNLSGPNTIVIDAYTLQTRINDVSVAIDGMQVGNVVYVSVDSFAALSGVMCTYKDSSLYVVAPSQHFVLETENGNSQVTQFKVAGNKLYTTKEAMQLELPSFVLTGSVMTDSLSQATVDISKYSDGVLYALGDIVDVVGGNVTMEKRGADYVVSVKHESTRLLVEEKGEIQMAQAVSTMSSFSSVTVEEGIINEINTYREAAKLPPVSYANGSKYVANISVAAANNMTPAKVVAAVMTNAQHKKLLLGNITIINVSATKDGGYELELFNDPIAITGASIQPMAAVANVVKVQVDGKPVVFSDQDPVIVEGRTLVPLRGVFEKMGFVIGWNGGSNTATLTKGTLTIVAKTNSKQLILSGGKTISMDVAAQIMNGRMMIPLRAVGEAAGCEVGWNPGTNTVSIKTIDLPAVTNPTTPPVATPTPPAATPTPPATEQNTGTNSGSWLPTDGFSIPGVSSPLKLGMTKTQIEAILGAGSSGGSGSTLHYVYKVSGSNVVVQYYNDKVRILTSNVAGTQAFGLKIGDAYPRNWGSNPYNTSKLPVQCEVKYMSPGGNSSSQLGMYFKDSAGNAYGNRLGANLGTSAFSNNPYWLNYNPDDSVNQNTIAGITLRASD